MGHPSTLLLDEYFELGEERFFAELIRSNADKKLAHYAQRLFDDRRPWAREMMLRYIDDGCDRPDHRGLVKRLFKVAERAGDDEVMVHFLIAFDRLVQHRIVAKRRWDWTAREYRTFHRRVRIGGYPYWAYASKHYPQRRFSLATRYHLRRRAARYFRLLGRRDPVRFRKAVFQILRLYREDHLARPEQVIDSWGLVHLLYHGSPVLRRDPRGVQVVFGRKVAELEPSPMHPEAFRGCADELLELLLAAPSLLVRRFVIGWLEKECESDLEGLQIELLQPLLASVHPEVQLFAVERLRSAQGLEKLPVEQWLKLLEMDNQHALPILCEQVERCVTPDRLSLEQCIALACARPMPVARLGLAWAKAKHVTGADLEVVARLRDGENGKVRAEGATWLVELMGEHGTPPEMLRDLIDARFPDVRGVALAVMETDERYRDEVSLWSSLAESPYDDARGLLIRHLKTRLSQLTERSVRHVWASTLLGVHRGSRTKRRVLLQLAERIVEEPAKADELLPLMAVALRSVREPERRAALGAIARAAFGNPTLREAIKRHVPELDLFPEEAA